MRLHRRLRVLSLLAFMVVGSLQLDALESWAEEPSRAAGVAETEQAHAPATTVVQEPGPRPQIRYLGDRPGFSLRHPRGAVFTTRLNQVPLDVNRSSRGARYSFANWSVIYESIALGTKELIVLENATAPRQFSFSLEVGNAKVRSEFDGFVVSSQANEPLFRIGPATAVDANGRELEVESGVGSGTLTLELKPLELLSIKFPITIDPSVVVASETYTESGRPNERRVFKATDSQLAIITPSVVGADYLPVLRSASPPYTTWSAPAPLLGNPCPWDLSAEQDGVDNIHVVSSCLAWDSLAGSSINKVFYQKLSRVLGGWDIGPVVELVRYGREPSIGFGNGWVFVSYNKWRSSLTSSVNNVEVIRSTNGGSSWSSPQILAQLGVASALTPAYSAVATFPHRLGVLYNDSLNTLQWRYAFYTDMFWQPPQVVGTVLYDRFSIVTSPGGHVQIGWMGPSASGCQLFATTCGDGALEAATTVLNNAVTCQLSTGEISIDGPVTATDDAKSYLTYSQSIGTDQWQLRQMERVLGSSSWSAPKPFVAEEKPFSGAWTLSSSVWTNETTDAADTDASDVPFFQSANDLLELESPVPFGFARVRLSTPASASTGTALYYWNGVAWITVPPSADTTNNMTSSGFMEFPPPQDWRPGPYDSSTYVLRLKRTTGSAITAPVATQITPVRLNRSPTSLSIAARPPATSWAMLPTAWAVDRYPAEPEMELRLHGIYSTVTSATGTAAGGTVLNMGADSGVGGVVAIGLNGPASGGVLNIHDLLGSPSAWLDPTMTAAATSVPGCTSPGSTPASYAQFFGSLPIQPVPEKMKENMTASIDWMIGAGCNYTATDGAGDLSLTGTYADGFVVRCKVHVADAMPDDEVKLFADWYRGNQPSSAGPGGYTAGDGFNHRDESAWLSLDQNGDATAYLRLADWAKSDAHSNVLGCAARLDRAGVQTPSAEMPQAWMRVSTPIDVWSPPTTP